MKFMRYRQPSLRTLLGVTEAKRRVKRELGISQVQAWTRPSRVKRGCTRAATDQGRTTERPARCGGPPGAMRVLDDA